MREPENARIVADTLCHFDGDRYELSGFVVMPNHVHVLFAPGSDRKLADIIQSWKRHSARMINVRMGASGRLWQPDYWDRLIRSPWHFEWVKGYIAANPKGLREGEFLIWSAAL